MSAMVSRMCITFLLCICRVIADQFSAMNDQSGTTDQNAAACPQCTTAASMADMDAITEDEIRQEILKFEKEKILQKLHEMEDGGTLFQGILTNQSHNRTQGRMSRSVKSDFEVLEEYDAVNPNGSKNFSDMSNFVNGYKIEYRMGKMPRGKAATFRCYDEMYGKIAACVSFPPDMELPDPPNWDRFKHAKLRFQLNSTFLKGQNKSARHIFSIMNTHNRGNCSDSDNDSLLFVSNTTAPTDDIMGKYLTVDITQLLLNRTPTAASRFGQQNDDENNSYYRISLRITCITCGNPAVLPVAVDPKDIPFLELAFVDRKRRFQSPVCDTKQNDLKTPESEGCCLVPVFITFKEIGYDRIVFPQGYLTGYCRGYCTQYTTRNYHAVVQKALMAKGRPDLQKEFKKNNGALGLCCTPLKEDDLQAVYRADDGHMEDIILKTMLVKACGC